MNNLYLKTVTEDEMITTLSFARVSFEGKDSWIQANDEFALSVIGNLYNDAVYGDELSSRGLPVCVTPPTKIDGFHANIICNDRIKDLIDATIIIDKPRNPKRKWSGE